MLAGCAADAPSDRRTPSALEPAGTGARIVLDEMLLHAALGAGVLLLILGLLVGIVWRQRRRGDGGLPQDDGDGVGVRWIWLGGIALPVVVLAVLGGRSVISLAALGTPPSPETVEIEVVGHRWWWEVRYPQVGVVTANELRLPAGESVQVRLLSEDVVHSFWIPELHHKLDMLPGEVNELWLHATEPGTYRGVCAEFCGLQHARMQLQAVVLEPDDYDAWLARLAEPRPAPQTTAEERGAEVFAANCAVCHTVDASTATRGVGPDLGNLAERTTIGGGVYPNNLGSLAGWVVDPQAMKPGALMPGTALDGDELQALLAYLDTLE